MDCTEGWRVTGYYTPVVSDFDGTLETVNFSDGTSVTVPASFLLAVKEEGWGKTSSGFYIGWDNRWYKSDKPLNALGNELVIGSAATDSSEIGRNVQFTITTLPDPWDSMIFTATDAGSAIIGKKVDIYCGEGVAAKQSTYSITGNDNTLCIVSTSVNASNSLAISGSQNLEDE